MQPSNSSAVPDSKLLELVLMEGADPNSKARHGKTPLHLAAKTGSVGTIDLLLSRGAQLDVLDELGTSALLEAVAHNHIEVARRLLSAGAKLAYNPDACLLTRTLPLDSMEADFRALKAPPPDSSTVNPISGKNCETMIADREEIPAWEIHKYAITECRSLKMLAMLVTEFQADPDQLDRCGYWPLKSFTEQGDQNAVEWLLERGAKVDQTVTGDTALFSAAANDNLKIARLLITAGANVNQLDVDGCVPLSRCESLPMAELLLQSGADPTILDQCGNRPWFFVDDPETRRFIRKQGRGRDC